MDFQFELRHRTLSTEQQAVLDAVNHLITVLPDQPDSDVALRLGLMILEVAAVAPQAELAKAAGFNQDRSVRVYQERMKAQGLAGLFDRPITGRPAITTQTPVEKALIQVILAAVMAEHTLPDDATLAERVNQALRESQAAEAGHVTASMVETIRLRWDIQRVPFQRALDAAPAPTAEPSPVQLGRTQVGGAFARSVAILLVETGWLKLAKLLPMAPGYAVTATQWLLTAIFSVVPSTSLRACFGIQRAFHLDDVCDIGFAGDGTRAPAVARHLPAHPAQLSRKSRPEVLRPECEARGGAARRRSAPHQPRWAQLAALYQGGRLGKGQNLW